MRRCTEQAGHWSRDADKTERHIKGEKTLNRQVTIVLDRSPPEENWYDSRKPTLEYCREVRNRWQPCSPPYSRTVFFTRRFVDWRRRLTNGEDFTIEMITLSAHPVHFSVLIERFSEFEQEGHTSFLLKSSPAAPQYVKYKMRDGDRQALIKLRSDEENGGNLCSYLSIQTARCPVGDLESRLRLDGRFQTVTTNGAIEVTRDQFNDGTFYIALIVQPHDHDCRERGNLVTSTVPTTERWKTATVNVGDVLNENQYVIAILVPIAVFLTLFFVALLLFQSNGSDWMAIVQMDLDGIVLPVNDSFWSVLGLMSKSVTGGFGYASVFSVQMLVRK